LDLNGLADWPQPDGQRSWDEVVVTIPSGSRRFEIRRLTTLHDEIKPESEPTD